MPANILLLSIKPEYASKIFSGEKTVELRRVRTRLIQDDIVLVYVSSPTKALVGLFEVENIIQEKIELQQDIKNYWNLVYEKAGISSQDFEKYYQGASFFVGIFLRNPRKFDVSINLINLRKQIPEFTPPQSYRYLKQQEFEKFKCFM
ncbi:MAG: ASCH domain-containing protein [Rivularia sp. ALOHA_DT_140]|nr:ASCH domain-containing protein [Rivularia sp. ALOHA_DT_140]